MRGLLRTYCFQCDLNQEHPLSHFKDEVSCCVLYSKISKPSGR